ncbi:MAG: hypothetical protein EOM50_22550 [Erysipelotrichia bacterium]|nr:hypothetical protein [Erysipelotrichia bacterium]
MVVLLLMFFIFNNQQEERKKVMTQTDYSVRLTKHNIRLVVDYFREYREFERKKSMQEIENELEKIRMQHQILRTKEEAEAMFLHQLSALQKRFYCEIRLKSEGKEAVVLPHQHITTYFNFEMLPWDVWQEQEMRQSLCLVNTHWLFKTRVDAYEINFTCDATFQEDYKDIEKDVKKIVQDGFALNESLHQGKIYLMWVNRGMSAEALHQNFQTLPNETYQNYCISKLSNVTSPHMGSLHVKKVLDVNDTEFMYHWLDEKPAIT